MASIGINDNKIISGIPNFIPIPSNLWYVLKKSREATFMRFTGFVFNYPCSMSCDNVERDGLGRQVKYMAFWNYEQVKSIRLDAYASKGISEEVAKALDVSLNHICTYRSDGRRTLIIVHTTYSGSGGVTESLSSELKNVGRNSFFYCIFNLFLHAQYNALQKSVEQVYGAGGLGGVSFMQLLHMFWSTQEALGEDFKETWVIVNPNYPIPFMSDTTNEKNEEGDSDIGMFELQVCDVGTFQKPFLTRWWHVNSCAAQVIRYFNSWKNTWLLLHTNKFHLKAETSYDH